MRKIAIASGKGGTGKTFVATNLFYTLLQKNFRAILVDCDAEAPDAVAFFETKEVEKFEVNQLIPVIDTSKCTFCGKCHEYCNYNAIFILPPMKVINVIEDLCHGCGACSVACRFLAISEKHVSLGQVTRYLVNGLPAIIEARMNIGGMSPVVVIKTAIKQTDNQAEIAILDAPPGTSCPFIQTVASADYVVLVAEPTPFGFSDLKQSTATLDEINKPYGVIINRSGLGDNVIYNWLKENNIPLLMEIPFDREIARIYSNGHLVVKENINYRAQFLELLNLISNSMDVPEKES